MESCGISCCHSQWLRRFANTRWFMIVYGLLGTIQATSYLYFVITLTTIEKRFKIPSQTTGYNDTFIYLLCSFLITWIKVKVSKCIQIKKINRQQLISVHWYVLSTLYLKWRTLGHLGLISWLGWTNRRFVNRFVFWSEVNDLILMISTLNFLRFNVINCEQRKNVLLVCFSIVVFQFQALF